MQQHPRLPFAWRSAAPEDEDEEEHIDDIRLVQAWVVDVPDPTHIAPMLRWRAQSGLGEHALAHLKRVRRRGPLATLLLDVSAAPPPLPSSPALAPAYQLPVPDRPARTPTSLALKNTFWPTVLCPKRKWEPEHWTHAQVCWASDAVGRLQRAARTRARDANELPIVAHVPVPYGDGRRLSRPFFAYDTRTSARHPLRHAALDLIRQIAADRAQQRPASTPTEDTGTQHLLTGLTVFMTHEPCIMCTMALLHSRVQAVLYVVPMPKTGGCGGLACVPALKGVNHRFQVGVWKADGWADTLDPETDA